MNVCIYRIPKKKSIFYPYSFCPSCRKTIKWYDNIPILSYIILKGKCRYCNTKISFQYPLVEFLTGILFVLLFLKYGLEKIYFLYIIIIGSLIIISFIDFYKKIVPDEIIVFLIIIGFIFNIFEIKVNIYTGIIGAIIGGFLIYILNFFSNGKIGEGDIKLIMSIGIITGGKDILNIIFLSFLIGSIISIIFLLKKIVKPKDSIPFAPFISIAFLIYVLIY